MGQRCTLLAQRKNESLAALRAVDAAGDAGTPDHHRRQPLPLH